jgi:hypothetical protein
MAAGRSPAACRAQPGTLPGVEDVRTVVEASVEVGIRHLTLYTFSTENWSHTPEELRGLLGLIDHDLEWELNGLDRNGVRLRHLGSLEGLAPASRLRVERAVCVSSGPCDARRATTVFISLSPSTTAGGQRSCGPPAPAPAADASPSAPGPLLALAAQSAEGMRRADPSPEALIDLLLELRRALRNAKQWQLSDPARGGLSALGISLQDSPAGTTWTRVS